MNLNSEEAEDDRNRHGKKVLSSSFRGNTHRWAVSLLGLIQRSQNRRTNSQVLYKKRVGRKIKIPPQVH
jgi:hypothetical protein